MKESIRKRPSTWYKLHGKVRITFDLNKELAKKLKKFGLEQNRTTSNLVSVIVAEFISKIENNKK